MAECLPSILKALSSSPAKQTQLYTRESPGPPDIANGIAAVLRDSQVERRIVTVGKWKAKPGLRHPPAPWRGQREGREGPMRRHTGEWVS